ncbi:MAG: MYXO-CTERM domain-containing protein, partial [Myxococcota bacterium]
PALCNPLVEPTGPCIDLDAFVAAGYTQPQIDEYIAAEVRGAHRWAFRWRAPMGSDPVELYLGVVDGDGGNRLDPAFADYQGDGVLMRQKTLWPTGSSTSDVKPAAVGCQAGIGGLPAALLLLLLAGLLTGLTRRRHRMALASAVVSSLVLFAAPQNVRAQTSCDIITGASCGWGEGCDCDHDGYVRSSAEAKRYCRYTRCPLDGDDRNPNVLGVPSVYNADGDGFTRDYDCDDSNQCINGACNNICGATTPPPPPPAPDTSVGTNMSDTSTTNGSDTYNVQDWLNDTNRTTSGPINAGAVDHATPPGPGCAGGTTDGVPSWVIVLSLLVGLTLIRRRRTRLVAAVLALAVAQVGCATTRPWERGQLAHGAMTFAGDGLEGQLEQHVLQYREGAAGGFGGGGGGCGCN